MATVQEFLNLLQHEDTDSNSLKTWLEENDFDIDAEIVFSQGVYGRTALSEYAYQGNERVVRMLLDAGAQVEGLTADGLETNEPNALSGAIVGQHTSIALLLLANGANPNLTNQYGMNSLHQAADERNLDVVNAILSGRVPIVDIDARNSTTEERLGNGRTALEYAEEENYSLMIEAINNYINRVAITGASMSSDIDCSS